MKKLTLDQVLPVIGGQILQGNQHLELKHAANEPDELEDHTLLFLFDEDLNELDEDLLNKYESYAIVVKRNSKAMKQITSASTLKRATIIEVPYIYEAYWKFVRYYRDLFDLPVICVTGTAGKTSTKDMVRHLLSGRYHVQATRGSRNSSSFNFPYLMGIDDKTDVAVFETGVAYYPGDIPHSCKFFKPTVGIITNIGVDHIRGCGSLENYIKAKGEMIKGLNYEGTLILNSDDANTAQIDLTSYKGRVFYIGTSKHAHFLASDIRYRERGMKFTVTFQNLSHRVFIPGYGVHQVYNAMAAMAAAYAIGVGIEESIERLVTLPQAVKRLQILNGVKGCTVLDDTWSSNSKSVESAINTLAQLPNGRKKIAVIGRMSSELHELAVDEHKKVGKLVGESGIDLLITRGDLAKVLGEAAIAAGMDKKCVVFCNDSDEVYQTVKPHLGERTVVLVKTSTNDSSTSLLHKLTRVERSARA
ncbi:MAG: UDP-N-acetylmuramoyl-tripeptide--D-alanyl-D-alanine ligase [Tumebacillaceae bacterium]